MSVGGSKPEVHAHTSLSLSAAFILQLLGRGFSFPFSTLCVIMHSLSVLESLFPSSFVLVNAMCMGAAVQIVPVINMIHFVEERILVWF